jgi:hypothetical protein
MKVPVNEPRQYVAAVQVDHLRSLCFARARIGPFLPVARIFPSQIAIPSTVAGFREC